MRCTGTAQAEFDERYISSTELCVELDVTRATLINGRRRGALPRNCVLIKRRNGDPHIILWLRDEAMPYVDRWKVKLGKGALAA